MGESAAIQIIFAKWRHFRQCRQSDNGYHAVHGQFSSRQVRGFVWEEGCPFSSLHTVQCGLVLSLLSAL